MCLRKHKNACANTPWKSSNVGQACITLAFLMDERTGGKPMDKVAGITSLILTVLHLVPNLFNVRKWRELVSAEDRLASAEHELVVLRAARVNVLEPEPEPAELKPMPNTRPVTDTDAPGARSANAYLLRSRTH